VGITSIIIPAKQPDSALGYEIQQLVEGHAMDLQIIKTP